MKTLLLIALVLCSSVVAADRRAAMRSYKTTTAAGIAFRSSFETTFAASASWVVTAPAGVASGDALLVFITSDTDHQINSYPSGWTEIEHSTLASSGFSVAWKLAGSEPANYTFGFTASEAGVCSIVAYSGCNSSPIDLDGINSSAGATITTAAITPNQANSMLVGCTFIDPAAGVVFSQITGFPLRSQQSSSTTAAHGIADRLQTSATSEGVQIGNDTGATFGGYTVALKPQ